MNVDPHQNLVAGRSTGPASGSNEVIKQAALNALRQWWKVTIPVGLVIAAVAVSLVYLTHVPEYEAHSTLLIKPKQEFIIDPGVRGAPSTRFVRTQQELIRSVLVLGPVVQREEIAKLPEITEMKDPLESLAKNIQLRSRANSDIYDLSYVGPEPQHAAEIVNAITDAYFKLVDEHEAQRDSTLIDLLSKEREAHAAKVTMLRDSVRELTKETTGRDPYQPPQEPDDVSVNPLSKLRTRLTQTAIDQAMLRAELATLEELDAAHPIEVSSKDVEAAVDQNAEVAQLKAGIEAKEQLARRIAAASAQGQRDRSYVQKIAEVARDQELLKKTREDLQKKTHEEFTGQYKIAREEEIASKRTALESADLLYEILEKRLGNEIVEQTDLSAQMLDLEFKRDELARAEVVFEKIADRIVMLQTEQRAPRQVEALRDASAPTSPIEEYPLKRMIMAGAAVFALPWLLAVAWEWRMQRVSDVQQLATFSRVPVLAEVASFPSGARSRRKSLSRGVSRALRHFEESIHSLRTYLVLSEPLTDMKVLAVTSSVSQEGKTSVATQLALSYSKSTGRVLLIDGDMRSPDVHRIFDVDREMGLANVLQGEATLSEAINRDWSDDIHILPAGRLSSDPHRLVAGGNFAALLDEIRDEYTTIIIDTPPILAASEALVMARMADAAILCTMRDVSRLSQVKSTYNRLTAAGAHPVGAVFSGVPMAKYYYNYGDYEYTSA